MDKTRMRKEFYDLCLVTWNRLWDDIKKTTPSSPFPSLCDNRCKWRQFNVIFSKDLRKRQMYGGSERK